MTGGVSGGGTAGGSSGPGVAGGVDPGAGAARLPDGGASLLGRLYAGALPLHPHTDDATGGVIDYLRTQWGADHLAAADPHSQYLQTSEGGISQADADLRFVNTAGDTVTGALGVDQGVIFDGGRLRSENAYGAGLLLKAPAATYRYVSFESGAYGPGPGSQRWQILGASQTPETGGNAGSDFAISRYSDAGGLLGTWLSGNRATGAATFGGAVTVNSGSGRALTVHADAASGEQIVFERNDGSLVGWIGADANNLVVHTEGTRSVMFGVGGNIHVNPTAGYFAPLLNAVTTLGHPSIRWVNVYTQTLDATGAATFGGALSTTGALTVQSKPVAVSPTAGNALTWDATGLYAAGGAGGAVSSVDGQTGAVDLHATYCDVSGDTITGALVLQGATATTNVLQAKLAADAQPRFRADASGLLEWGTGAGVPTASLSRAAANELRTNSDLTPTPTNSRDLGAAALSWRTLYCRDLTSPSDSGFVRVGLTNPAAAGEVRLRNTGALAWRNAGNTADLTLAMNANDRLALAVGAANLTTSATGGSATAPPAQPVEYLSVVVNGNVRKLVLYS